MNERGRGARTHEHTALGEHGELVEGGGEVAPPNVVTVDDAGDDAHTGEFGDVGGGRAPHEVDADRLDASLRQRTEDRSRQGRVACLHEQGGAGLRLREALVGPRRRIHQLGLRDTEHLAHEG